MKFKPYNKQSYLKALGLDRMSSVISLKWGNKQGMCPLPGEK